MNELYSLIKKSSVPGPGGTLRGPQNKDFLRIYRKK